MKALIEQIFGHGEQLTPMQTLARAIVVFVFTLALLRFSGRRSFGMRSPFDNVVVVLLGAVLSRAITGASPFWDTVTAALALVTLHRIIAYLCVKFPSIERLVKGERITLIKHGEVSARALLRGTVSLSDLQESLRRSGLGCSIEDIDAAYLERSGEITFVRRKVGE